MAKVIKEQRTDRTTGKPVSKYVVRYRDPAGKQREKTFSRSHEASLYAAQVTTDMASGQYREPKAGRINVESFIREHLTGHTGAPGTLDKYQSVLTKHVAPVLGAYPLDKLRRSHVQQWVKGLSDKGLAPGTVRNLLKVFAGWMNVAVGDGIIRENPCSRVSPPAAAPKLPSCSLQPR